MRRSKKPAAPTALNDDLGRALLPPGFEVALEQSEGKGSICAISRVAQDRYGNVTHAEWGVTTPWLDDWLVGPVIAAAKDVAFAVSHGAAVFTLFPTATGFACGPQFVVDGRGQLATARGHPPEWNVSMLARLNLPRTLN